MGATLRIEIFPADVDASVGFYERLGFPLVGLQEGPSRYAYLRWDDVRIGMVQSPRHPPEHRAVPVGTEIVIDVDDVRAMRDHVVGRSRRVLPAYHRPQLTHLRAGTTRRPRRRLPDIRRGSGE